ncbi:hypothetical protein IPF37_00695 [bacterium]|nr:MAG: hypothetical protein IPF37_00695 [bacterium]
MMIPHNQRKAKKVAQSVHELGALFPKNEVEVASFVERAMVQATEEFNAILAIPDEQRTFDNTMRAP